MAQSPSPAPSGASTRSGPYDAIVLGLGGVGSSALWHLARRGQRVLGIDRFEPGHSHGSSHGETRIIRMAYFEHSSYVPLLRRAYELWDELEQASREQLFFRTGIIELGPPDGQLVPRLLECSREHQLDVEHLSSLDAHQRYTALFIPDHFEAVIERNAGYLLVERCVQAHFEQARQAGAEAVIGDGALYWEVDGQGVRVVTEQSEYRAARLVLTAGPWAHEVLAHERQGAGQATEPANDEVARVDSSERPPASRWNLPLQIRRKHLHWFHCDDARYHERQKFPAFFFELPEGYFYGFPQRDHRGVKVSEHSGGTVIDDPLADERKLEDEDFRRVQHFMQTYLPYVSPIPTQHSVCFYTMSPDEHFVIDRHPEHPQVVLAAGLSGHGFKFTSVLGEVLADLAIDGSTRHPIDFLGAKRFSS